MSSLSQAIKDLLNKFADTQTALRLPTLPLESSNPMLGDALDTALDDAAGSSSASDASDSADAAAASASDASDSADAAAASAATAAGYAAYTPAQTTDWTGADPTTVQQALDRIAAALGPIA